MAMTHDIGSGASPFIEKFHSIRDMLENPKEFDWILHTNIGLLWLKRIQTTNGPDIVVHCLDQDDRYRFLVFTDQLLASFPLEVAKKIPSIEQPKQPIGFMPFTGGEEVN